MDLTNDAPDAKDVADDPTGAAKDGALYAIGAGIIASLFLAGYRFIALPALSAMESTMNAVQNAADAADASDPLGDDEVF